MKKLTLDVMQNICGMSVVPGADFEQLKRFNVAEIGAAPVEKKKEKEEE